MKPTLPCLLLILFFFFSLTLSAQQDQVIKGKVSAAGTGQALARATIKDESGKVLTYTNDSGAFIFLGSATVRANISFIGYEAVSVILKASKENQIILKASAEAIREVEVFPELPRFIYFGSAETQVLDYEFVNDYTLIALYNYHSKKTYAVLLGPDEKILSEILLPANFQQFYKSCINKYYVLTTSNVFELSVSRGGMVLKPVGYGFFHYKVIYYLAWYQHYFYLGWLDYTKQTEVFFLEDTKEKIIYQSVPFAIVGDSLKEREAGHAIGRIMADKMKKAQELFPNFDPRAEGTAILDAMATETPKGILAEQRLVQEFIEKPVYAPLYLVDTTVMVFDFYKDRLMKYPPLAIDLKPESTIPLQFHKESGWSKWLYKDREDRFYTAYHVDEGKVKVCALDPQTWAGSELIRLYHPRPEKLKVRDGYVYYLQQPKEKGNLVFLFREKWNKE